MTIPTPSPAAGSEELREKVLELCDKLREHVDLDHPDPDMTRPCQWPADIADEIMHLIATQNDATYAKVMEDLNGLEIDREASENHIRKVAKDNAQIQQALLSMEIDADDRHDVLDDVRQSITKIFGKTDAKPEEEKNV